MKLNAGVWVDHRSAVIVTLQDGAESTVTIESGAERQLRRSSDRSDGPYEPLAVPADDTQKNIFAADLNRYYDEIIAHLKTAGAVYIIGPGEARTELKKRMESRGGALPAIHVEAADSMSAAQVAARIRGHFQHS